ncbi:MAG: DUF4184 family protein [Steroidobacteraceae bacterium]
MPFTLSHTAAILPFARTLNRWRALSAAMIGSMVPDFSLLVPWHVQRFQSHSLEGLVTFCLPLGLLSYWIFEYVVKPATWEILPDAAHLRSTALARPDPIDEPRQWLVAVIGVLGGAITHLVWDGFTHEGARGVRMIPALDDSVDIAGHPLYAFQIAQHACSILGLALVTWLLVREMRAAPAMAGPVSRALDHASRRRWMAAYVVAALFFCAVSFRLTWMTERYGKSWSFIIDALGIGGLRGLLFSVLAVSALLRARLARPARARQAA